MTLSDYSSIASLVSSAAVFVSLVFVGLQILQNTRAIRAQIHQNITDGWIGVCAIIADHSRAFAAGVASDETAFASMSDSDKTVYMSAIFSFFKHYENMYLQNREGFIREDDWAAWVSHMFMYWRMPGVQLWWKTRADAFAPEFRRFIETSSPSSMPTMIDVFGHRPVGTLAERVD